MTYDDANPDWLTITVPTLGGNFDFRLNPSQGDLFHYRLGRALHSAGTTWVRRTSSDHWFLGQRKGCAI